MLIYLMYAFKGFIKFKLTDIIIVYFMIIRFIFTKDLESFGLSYLLVVRYLDYKNVDLRRNKLLLYLLPLSVVFYSILHRINFSNYIVSTSIGEVNQVGFSLIMLYLIFRFNNLKLLSNLVIVAGIMTFSRNFFLGIILYIVSDKILRYFRKKRIRMSIPTSFQFYSILSIIVVLVLYLIFSQVTDVSQFKTYDNMFERFFTYFDNSNYQRFVANIAVVKFYLFKPIYLLTGIPFEIYRQYLLQYSFGFGLVAGKINAPHNYFFKFLYKYGAFSLLAFSITAKAVNKRLNVSNLPVFLTFLLYAVFLGTGFYEAYLIILIYLLDNSNENISLASKINTNKI